MMTLRGLVSLALSVAAALFTATDLVAQQVDCNRPAPEPVVTVALPGTPFLALPTRDGCWVFVSMSGSTVEGRSGIGVLKRTAGSISFVRVFPIDGAPTGMVLTGDQGLLVAASGSHVAFVDVKRATDGGDSSPILGYWSDGTSTPAHIYVNLTRDHRYLFVSREQSQTITVLDLPEVRRNGYNSGGAIGKIPVCRAPIALTFSTNERYLYTTSQAMPDRGWAVECKPESGPPTAPPDHPQGAVIVIDVVRAKVEPARSVKSIARAGCNPVRLALSLKGDTAYVSARGSHALLAFDTGILITDPIHAQVASVPVGRAPVGAAVVDEGRKILATNSNRFACSEKAEQ
jgi:DNA-binding beta-propeller fold protein YncE